jgi:DNA replication protein DnaC
MKADGTPPRNANPATDALRTQLASLPLTYVLEHFESLANVAAEKQWPHPEYLGQLIEGEAHQREERSIARRISLARFPVIKTLDQFQWNWPKKINRLQIQNLFRLAFVEEKAKVVFLAGVGLGKSQVSIAIRG